MRFNGFCEVYVKCVQYYPDTNFEIKIGELAHQNLTVNVQSVGLTFMDLTGVSLKE